MFTVIELLGKNQDLGSAVARYDDNSILIGDDDVVSRDFDAVTVDRHIHATETVVPH